MLNSDIDKKAINEALESDDIDHIKKVLDDLFIAYDILQEKYQDLYQSYRRYI